MGQLSNLPNIGKVLEKQLKEVDIETPQQLANVGTEEAWLRIQFIDPSACIHRLYSIEGAILGVKNTFLPKKRKDELHKFYIAHAIKGVYNHEKS